MAAKKKTANELLVEAIEAEDNLKIFKAQRRIIGELISGGQLEAREVASLNGQLSNLNKLIIEIEGLRKEPTEAEKDEAKMLAEAQAAAEGMPGAWGQ